MNYRRRVDALECRLRPPSWDNLSPLHQDWYREFQTSPAVVTVWQFADVLASMRYHAEGHMETAPRSGHCDDWKAVTTPQEREQRTYAEVERLAAMMGEHDTDTALTLWTETAARAGWPRLAGPTYSIDARGFDQLFRLHRSQGDEARLRDDPPSTLWRHDHPAWRPGMTFGEMLEEAAASERTQPL
jgi:hypothetical protein